MPALSCDVFGLGLLICDSRPFLGNSSSFDSRACRLPRVSSFLIQSRYLRLPFLVFEMNQTLQPAIQDPMPDSKADFADNSNSRKDSKYLNQSVEESK